jgi:GT2 family glycosyltransferase
MKITLGISTYNGSFRLNLLLSSILNYTTEKELEDIDIIVVDDGTPNPKEESLILQICNKYKAIALRHPQNKGISAAWNTLSSYRPYNDLIILFNDDIQICHPAWLKCLLYFFKNNSNVGHVSYQTFNLNPKTALPRPEQIVPDISIQPKFSWTPNGQAFAFKKSVYDEVGGFWRELVSFYEECDFGYEVSHRSYCSYIIPFPPIQHWGSQSFGSNPELIYTVPNEMLPMEKYRELLRPKFSDSKIEPFPGKVYRMEYSRALFALKWGCKDYWDKPQDEIDERLKGKVKNQHIKWLDDSDNERVV